MSLRTPRFKNEFLALQNIKVEGNLLIKTDLSNIVDKSIVDYVSNKQDSNYTFGILDFTGTAFEATAVGAMPVVFESDVGKQGVERNATIHTYYKSAYNIKYFLSNIDFILEEDREFFTNLVKNSLIFTPQYSYVDRTKAQLAGKVSHIQTIQSYVTLGMSDYYMTIGDINKCTTINEQFRYMTKVLLNTTYDANYNIFVGTQKVSYVDLKAHTKDNLFKFVYMYFYRLYDMTLNKHLKVNSCIVISGLRHLFDLNNYRTFMINEQEAKDRLYKIKSLIIELLEKGKDYNLFFILLDMNNDDYDLLSNYCFAIESEVGSLQLEYN
ncbi:hypothetical protein [Psittacicella gerlachiana]|uniref:Uncharacterized protein n=1 Tax=Psittacicella gerlachiana TaxID=2028574 RepID=A0A3A1YPP3_9GAMM|nr:hypothetical protein [Psittacicella gerlachiana]RIY38930.1 hypothetical protein CKF59_00070 [Psittacicella gerlachiana]